MRSKILTGAAALTLVAIAGLVTTAQAANRYGVACLNNRTKSPINFSAKVGNGQWQRYSLASGSSRSFWHRYEQQNEDRSPNLVVRFDSDLSGGQYYLQYKLTRRTAQGNSCSEGKAYAFLYEPNNRNFIDLKALA